MAALLLWPTYVSMTLVVSPQIAQLPTIERRQYIEGWPAGYGLPELGDYIETVAESTVGGINLLRFNRSGPAYQGLDVYLSPSAKITKHTIDSLNRESVRQAQELVSSGKLSLLVIHSEEDRERIKPTLEDGAVTLDTLRVAWRYNKPGNISFLEVWQVRTR